MKKILLQPSAFILIALSFILHPSSFLTAAPIVSNVEFSQQPDGEGSTQVVVNYDLVSDDGPSTVSLLFSLNATPFEFATVVSGDVGGGIDTGTAKEILWSVAEDIPSTESTNLVVRVLAEDGQPIEVEISAAVANGGPTNNPNQTVIFTFDEAVSGFSADNVTVTNATKGTFGGSGAVYTLDITADELGLVNVSIPANAAVSAFGTGNGTAAGAFAYQYELLEFVSVPAGTFTMGNSAVGDDATFETPNELPNHEVTLSAYDIGRYQVTNGEFATVMNWALAQGYLANDTAGTPYAGAGFIYLMAPDSTATRQPLFDTVTGDSFSQIEWTGSAFAPRTRNSQSMADHPMLRVSWYGSVAFCNFLAEMEGKPLAYDLFTWELIDADPGESGLQYVASYRLPTESERERAAAWSLDYTTRFVYGTSSDNINNTRATFNSINPMGLSTNPRTSPVGWFNGVNISPNGNIQTVNASSPVGAYDMAGNVWEWCQPWFDVYTADAKTDPTGPASGSDRVVRGGGWGNDSPACRTARRFSIPPTFRTLDIGFRIAIARDQVPLTITAPVVQNEPTNEATQTITMTFGEDVSGFDVTDITVNNGILSNFTTVSADVYTVDVTASSEGFVGIVVEAGVATGTSSRDSGGAGFGYEVDTTAPTIASTDPADEATIASLSEIVVTFSEEVINLTAGQLTVNGSPADTISGTNPYTFSGFTDPGAGLITVALAGGTTTDAAGNAFAGDSWSYVNELLEFVSVPAGTFTMGNSGVGDDATYETPNELPNHEVTLSAYDIGRYQVTTGEFVTVMNWALAQGYLANDTAGTPYAGAGLIHLMAPDSTATRQPLFDTVTGDTYSQIEWTGSSFAPRTRDTFSMADHPMVHISWFGSVAFCNFLAEMEGKPVAYNLFTWELIDADPGETGLQYVASYRLPTESEWERAAAWSLDYTTRFVYGTSSDNINNTRATFNSNNPMGLSTEPRTSPVGWFNGVNISPNGNIQTVNASSPVGAYDMTGNAGEWCHNWHDDYTDDAKTDPSGPASGSGRVIRGGGWGNYHSSCRSAWRVNSPPNFWNFDLGFRVVAVR
ncbi:MAG: SUMF1/EgtB/PvdO family nonheme iron enzyme [Candidatus Sumerlaeia bacterium]|nr:SUMF1/EgtB/PvdO family nonheme iron enzyme [Candidatus Sumerlaeia bacterium]